MRRSVVLILAVVGLSSLPPAAGAANGHASSRAVCPGAPIGAAHCHALVVTDAHGNPDATTAPTGLSPVTIRSVYGFPTGSTAGAGETIAIVDAYDDPTAESDLGVFSGQYGLPACTTGNGCFVKVDQNGGTNYPTADQGWALEISLDVQWAHAVAPGARILLVEASSNTFADLLTAEDYARAHAQYVSNSWGGSEFAGENLYDAHFVQSGVSFFVSAGDSGLPAEYPSASPNVISVGGTTLTFNADGSLQSETGWSSGGGGCSASETANPAQSAFSEYGQVGCGGRRATPDVSLDADPSSGVAVYDSTPYYGQTGWFTVGGTSASSPMWAARSADTGAVVDAAYVYGNGIAYRDVTVGNNGAPCLVGYDLCTGRGSWAAVAPAGVSIGSFAPSSGTPGTSVLIHGSGFTGATAVAFAGTTAAFSVASDTSITATVPAGAASGTISVTAPSGTATNSTPFTVTSAEPDVAVAYQIGVDHRGFQSDSALAPPLERRWLASFPNPTSYPLIAAGKVYVTASASPNSGTTLYALDQSTGAQVWSKAIPGTYAFSASAYDAGQVFVLNSDGLLQAFAAGTGALAWSNRLQGQSMFTSPPTAGNGVVYVGGAGSGGTVYAVDELSGGLIATQSVMNGDHSSPALAGGSVFASYACDQAYGFAQTSLSPLWHYSTGCEGGGGKTVVSAGGYVFTRDATNGNLILAAADGSLVGSWTPAGTTALAPAADSASLYTLSFPAGGAVLAAQALTGNATRWTFTGDGQLDTAPIVLSTPSGEFVVEGSATGTLYALDAATGAQVWSTSVGAAIPRPDEQNAVQLTGIAAGQGLLVVPAGNTLAAYAAAAPAAAPVVSSFAPTSGAAGTSVTITGSGFTGATAVAFDGTAATFSVVDDGHVTATVPAEAASGPISVTSPAGTGTSSGSFTVVVPDFTIAASPSSQAVVAGNSVAYAVSVTPTGGFAGTVSLSVSGVPAGATASFSPSTTTSTSTLTVQTARSTKNGTSTLTITGTSGVLAHSTAVTLQVSKK